MKRKQHLQSFLSVCNKRLPSATARHAGKRPSEQFAVSFFADYLFQKEKSECYSRARERESQRASAGATCG